MKIDVPHIPPPSLIRGWVRMSDWVKETHCVVKAEWKCIFIWFYDFSFFVLFYEFFIFFICFYSVCYMSSESPSDGDFPGSQL